ncbi:MAG TPA: hypothetical protein VIH84_00550, partial [Candidatus Methylomirabilis sp.]
DLETVKNDLAAIRKELGEIRRLLTQRPAQPQPAQVTGTPSFFVAKTSTDGTLSVGPIPPEIL